MQKEPSESYQFKGQGNSTEDQRWLPQGTCSLKDRYKFEEYMIMLSSPLYEYLTLPYQLRYFPCVIVKQNVEGENAIYHLCYEVFNKRMLSAQKQPNNIGCNYIISKNEKPEKNQCFVGKLRGNYSNTQFIVYDGGQNPKNKCVRKRRQLSSIKYIEQSIFNQNKDRVQMVIPQITQTAQSSKTHPKYCPKQFIPLQNKQNMLFQQYRKKSTDVIKLTDRRESIKSLRNQQQPDLLAAFLSQMGGIQEKLSIIIQTRQNQQVLLLGRRSKNTFSLRIGYPLSIIQGFGFALSAIQRSSK